MIYPKRALLAKQIDATPIEFIDSSMNSIWTGNAYKWRVKLQITPTDNSGATPSFTYNANHIVVGDWVSVSPRGIANQIVEIVDLISDTEIDVIVEDIDLYNTLTDTTGLGNGIGPDNTQGFVFPLDDTSGLPVLGPVASYAVDLNMQMDLFARFIQQKQLKGGSGGAGGTIGTPTDGDINDGALECIVPDVTTVTDGIDQLSRLLAFALPPKPKKINNAITNLWNKGRLSAGNITNYGTTTVNPNDEIIVAEVNTTNKALITDTGLANDTSLIFMIDGSTVGNATLDSNSNIGTFGNIEITDDFVYPRNTNSPWQAIDANFTFPDTLFAGVHDFRISMSCDDALKKAFALDETKTGLADQLSVSVTTPLLTYSSGIPHLTNNSELKYSSDISNFAGVTFSNSIVQIQADSNVGDGDVLLEQVKYDEAPFSSNVTMNNPKVTITDKAFLLKSTPGESTGRSGDLLISVSHPLQKKFYQFGNKLNYLFIDAPTDFIVENPIEDSSKVSFKRMLINSNNDKPVISAVNYASNWNSGDANSIGDMKNFEAKVIGGIARFDKSDYSSNTLPVGPDYRNHLDKQYITFKCKKITNRIKINIEGEFDNFFVMIPGITNDMPNATNRWWDANKQANFPQTLWPGHASSSDGCLVNKANNTYELTFGSISTAFSTDNMILLRFVLSDGQYISSIKVVD